MIHQDSFGCDTALSQKEALEHWNNAIIGFLAHSASTAHHLSETLKIAPDFVLGHTFRGFANLLLCRRELIANAHDAFTTAQNIAKQKSFNQRESDFLQALEQWLKGKPSQSVCTIEKILVRTPHDPLAMKLSQAIQFILGDIHGMRRSTEKLINSYDTNHPAYGYFMGCYAFCLEETGEYQQAESYGRKGLEFSPDDAWGLHAVAHVYDMTANSKTGVQWLNGQEHAWRHCNNFRYHVWWHLALMHLDLGDVDSVLNLYDTEIRNEKTDDYRDISNATSLLMRLELEGVNVGKRWEELAEISEKRTDDTTLAFADLHYMLALCGGQKKDAAAQLIHNMQICDNSQSDTACVISDPGLIAAKGLEAFHNEDYKNAYSCLSQARGHMQHIGGSHAQRDVFERITIEAALKASLPKQAHSLLQDRDKHRGFQDGYSLKRYAVVEHMLQAYSEHKSEDAMANIV
ncbi:MAG: tetratricopeptide repeat protein [Pseudomonadota bacterium]